MSRVNAWWLACRPKTLPASISPIILGSALAWHFGGFRWIVFMLALVCALALQIAVNLANDWFDAHSGVDGAERLGPLRVTQMGLISGRSMALGLGLVLALAMVSGLLLAVLSSLWLLLFGLCSMLAVFAYSAGPWPLASHALGEVTVFFFFGWLAVGGVYFAHSLHLPPELFAYGSVAGFLSAAIMLVNNLRDINTDAPAGKVTLAVVLGDQSSRRLYVFLLLAAAAVHAAVSWLISPWLTLLPLAVLLPETLRLMRAARHWQGAQLNQLLAHTARLLLAYCGVCSLLLLAPVIQL